MNLSLSRNRESCNLSYLVSLKVLFIAAGHKKVDIERLMVGDAKLHYKILKMSLLKVNPTKQWPECKRCVLALPNASGCV